MVKCALCRGRVALTKQLCNDCHVFKELMTRFGKDQVIVRHVLPLARFGSVSSARKRKHKKFFIHSHSIPPSHITAPQSARARVATIALTLERVFSAQNIIQHPLSLPYTGSMLLLSLRLVCENECQSDLGQLPSLPHQPRTVTPQDQLPNLVQGLKEASVGVRNHDLTVSSSCNHLDL